MKIAPIVAVMLFVIFFSSLVCFGQDKLRRIEQPAKFTYSNTPIQVDFSIDGKPIRGRELQAGIDWLRRISLKVTNLSEKEIKSLVINLMLKEPVYGAREATPATAGIVITIELSHADPRIDVLMAGANVTLQPPTQLVDYWTKYAQAQGIDDIERVILDVKQVGFTDDSAWTRGRLSRKDPASGRQVFVSEWPGTTDLQLLPTSSFQSLPRSFF